MTFEEVVRSEVRRRGRITFAEYMEWALYHPQHGYYTSGAVPTGRQGDFFTNAQVGPLFGRLLAESFAEMWDQMGSGHFTLVELGAGDGRLAEQVLLALERKGRRQGLRYCLVEQSPLARETAKRRLARFPRLTLLDRLESLEHVSGVEGCVFSNEFFDALPFHRVLWEGGELRELYVQEEGGRLVEKPGEPSTPRLSRFFEEQGVALSEGQKAEVCLKAEEAMAEIERALARGFVLTIDYGEPSADLYRESRREGTLQAYRKHRRETDPFQEIGRRDLTALVDFGRLAALGLKGNLRPLVFASQGTYFLNSAEAVLREAVEGGPDGRRDLSLARQVQQLVHPQSFGGAFHVLVQGKNVGEPSLSGGKVNRVRRLLPAASKGGR